jgi:hypothetical protein
MLQKYTFVIYDIAITNHKGPNYGDIKTARFTRIPRHLTNYVCYILESEERSTGDIPSSGDELLSS